MNSALRKLRWLLNRSDKEAELEAELQFHLEKDTEERQSDGLTQEEARLAALRAFGNATIVKENARAVWIPVWLEQIAQDVRFTLRAFRKHPGFVSAAIAMLALGIGMNSAIFTVADAALFRGLPGVRRSDRIVQISTTKGPIYFPDFEVWRAQAKAFAGIALVRGIYHTFSDDSGAPDTYYTMEVTPNTFEMLGVRPLLGRDFAPTDAEPGAPPVVVLRYEMWARRFGANPRIVGQIVQVDGFPARVIGVMPQGFSFPATQDLWTPLIPDLAALRRETFYAPFAYGRLAEGATEENARAELGTIGRRLANEFPKTNRNVIPVVKSFGEWFAGGSASLLYRSMWGAVVLVLLIICANVGNLSIEQAMGRSHEIAVRMALGAGRWRIVRQFLIQSFLLSFLAALVGWEIAKAIVHIYGLAQSFNYVRLNLRVDNRVLAYLVAISVATALLTGLVTAAYLTKIKVNGAFAESYAITAGKLGRRLSNLLVCMEMILAVALLASAGVLARSFLRVYEAKTGINDVNVLSLALNAPPQKYTSPEARLSFYRDATARLQALPGVESVALASTPPTENATPVPYELEGAVTAEPDSLPTVAAIPVSDAYFRTLGARVISGRAFDDSDRVSSAPTALVNDQFAKKNWPGGVPLGKRLRLFQGIAKEPSPWMTVVGVVSNIVQNDRTRQAFEPLVYVSSAVRPPGGFAFLRTTVPPEHLIPTVKRELYAIDPDLPVPVIMPLSERLGRNYALERNVTFLVLSFSFVALIIASVGLYATVAHSVTRRAHEIGIRIAIGASRQNILGLIFRQGLIPVLLGLAAGLSVSFASIRILRAELVGVSPADPVALIAACAALVLGAAMGCWIPARRALRLDPAAALRHE